MATKPPTSYKVYKQFQFLFILFHISQDQNITKHPIARFDDLLLSKSTSDRPAAWPVNAIVLLSARPCTAVAMGGRAVAGAAHVATSGTAQRP